MAVCSGTNHSWNLYNTCYYDELLRRRRRKATVYRVYGCHKKSVLYQLVIDSFFECRAELGWFLFSFGGGVPKDDRMTWKTMPKLVNDSKPCVTCVLWEAPPSRDEAINETFPTVRTQLDDGYEHKKCDWFNARKRNLCVPRASPKTHHPPNTYTPSGGGFEGVISYIHPHL